MPTRDEIADAAEVADLLGTDSEVPQDTWSICSVETSPATGDSARQP